MIYTNCTSVKQLEKIYSKLEALGIKNKFVVVASAPVVISSSLVESIKTLSAGAEPANTADLILPKVNDVVVIVPGSREVGLLHIASCFGAFCRLFYAFEFDEKIELVEQIYHTNLLPQFWFNIVYGCCNALLDVVKDNEVMLEHAKKVLCSQDFPELRDRLEEVFTLLSGTVNEDIHELLNKVFKKD